MKKPWGDRRTRGRPAGTDFFTRNADVASGVNMIVYMDDCSAPAILKQLKLEFGGCRGLKIATLRRYVRKLKSSRSAATGGHPTNRALLKFHYFWHQQIFAEYRRATDSLGVTISGDDA